MTRRTRRLLMIGLPAVLVAVLLTTWLFWPRTPITRGNATRIVEGLSLAEVEGILGGPARDESTGPAVIDGGHLLADAKRALESRALERVRWANADAAGDPPRVQTWLSDHVMVIVQFDADGRVTACDPFPVHPSRESPLDRLRRWLGF